MSESFLNSLGEDVAEFYNDFIETPEKPYASIIDYIESKKNVCIDIVESEALEGKAYIQELSCLYKKSVCSKKTSYGLEKEKKLIIFTGIQPEKIKPAELKCLMELENKHNRDESEEINCQEKKQKSLDFYKYRFILGHELGHIYFDDPTNEDLANRFSYALIVLRGPVLSRLSLEDNIKTTETINNVLHKENSDEAFGKLIMFILQTYYESLIQI
jgi:hypothetical protein